MHRYDQGKNLPVPFARRWCAAAVVSFAFVFAGCSSFNGGRVAGAFRGAVMHAATAPETWVPLLAAGAIDATRLDKEISVWAFRHTPVFGSTANADRWSDYCSGGAQTAHLVTSLMVSEGNSARGLLAARSRSVALGIVARELTWNSTGFLKEATQRGRPDASDTASFPSAHTANAAVNASLAARNLEYIPVSDGCRAALRAGLTSMTVATAWARVEAQKHHATDVLAGAALGSFFGILVSDLFLGPAHRQDCVLDVKTSRKDFLLGMRVAF